MFKGYVSKCAVAVLSGGRYDNLARKYAEGVSAMGFAICLNELSHYFGKGDGHDGDVFVRYHDKTDVVAVLKVVEELTKQGKKVSAGRAFPQGAKYKKVIELEN